MKRVLSKSRYLILIPVVMSLLASLAAFLWGAVKTLKVIHHLYLSAMGEGGGSAVELIALMDTFLIATALFIFAIGLYELFIGEIDFPEWLVIHDLHSLKSKLASVIVLVMAVIFLEKMTGLEGAWEVFLYAAAVTLVSGALIAFGIFGKKD